MATIARVLGYGFLVLAAGTAAVCAVLSLAFERKSTVPSPQKSAPYPRESEAAPFPLVRRRESFRYVRGGSA